MTKSYRRRTCWAMVFLTGLGVVGFALILAAVVLGNPVPLGSRAHVVLLWAAVAVPQVVAGLGMSEPARRGHAPLVGAGGTDGWLMVIILSILTCSLAQVVGILTDGAVTLLATVFLFASLVLFEMRRRQLRRVVGAELES